MTGIYIIVLVHVFILIEYLYTLLKKKNAHFNYENTVSNISIGILERLINVFLTPLFYWVYTIIYNHFSIWKIPENVFSWIALVLLTDFIWYWYHRLGHRVNLFWAAHIVHHQSEDFNLSIAARITVFQAFIRTFFWAILVVIGFSPTMLIVMLAIHGAYSFFTHTRAIGKLGWLEYIFITPSHHRVHHASNEEYLDKNYGDVFVFWDKLFGTFQAEEKEPVYGLTQPINSHSFLWQHFHYYLELIALSKRQKGLIAKIRVFFGPPTIMDPKIRGILERKWLKNSEKQTLGIIGKIYIGLQLVSSTVLLCYIFYRIESGKPWDLYQVIVLSVIILLTLINCGAIAEQRKWVYETEVFRLWVIYLLFAQNYWAEVALIPMTLIFTYLGQQDFFKRRYLQTVYQFSANHKSK